MGETKTAFSAGVKDEGFVPIVVPLRNVIDRLALAYSIEGGRCESPIERDALIALHRALPGAVFCEAIPLNDLGDKVIVIQQFRFRRYRLDFAICLECDGYASHHGREAEDLRRDGFLKAAGFAVFRVKGRDLFRDADAALSPLVCYIGSLR